MWAGALNMGALKRAQERAGGICHFNRGGDVPARTSSLWGRNSSRLLRSWTLFFAWTQSTTTPEAPREATEVLPEAGITARQRPWGGSGPGLSEGQRGGLCRWREVTQARTGGGEVGANMQARLGGRWGGCSFHWVRWEATQQRNDTVWIMFRAEFGCHDKLSGEQRQEQRDQFGDNTNACWTNAPQPFQTAGIHCVLPRLVSVTYASPLPQQHCLSPSGPV